MNTVLLTHKWILAVEKRVTGIYYTYLEKLRNKANPNKTYINPLKRGNRQELLI